MVAGENSAKDDRTMKLVMIAVIVGMAICTAMAVCEIAMHLYIAGKRVASQTGDPRIYSLTSTCWNILDTCENMMFPFLVISALDVLALLAIFIYQHSKGRLQIR